MTLIPSDAWNVAGVEGDSYKVGPFCDAPGCKRPVDHKHHLWRRSFLGGDYWWVRVPTPRGTTAIRNVIGLCYHHHQDVTGDVGGHKAWIRWSVEREEFDWLEAEGYGKWMKIGTLAVIAPNGDAAPSPSAPRSERCPTCGKLKSQPHVHHEPGPKRPRKTWALSVPDDSEDGAAVLDELIEGLAELIGMEDYSSRLKRYHVIVPALVFALQHSSEFAEEFLAA